MGKFNFKSRVFVFLLGFCALLLGILWLFQTVFLEDMYKAIRRQELNRVIADVEREISLLEVDDFSVITVRVQAENDIMVVPTPEFIMPPQHQFGRGFERGRGNPMQGTITEVREFELANGQTISLTFHAMIVPVNATVSTLRLQLYIITAIMIISAAMLSILIAKPLNTAAVELERVETLRRELLANISHDLRTPLALIYGYAEMMSDFPDEITAEQVRVIMDETERLTTLVNDVLDLSRHESDADKPNFTRFDVTASVSATVARVQELLKGQFDIRFCYDKQAFINADETMIVRAFYNLLINAVNHSGESRIIEVTQSCVAGNRVHISVVDYGEGIDKDDLPFIWDRYYKSGKSHKRAVTGTGLGLSIVKKIVALHGGRYGVESAVGEGSRFWVEV